MNRHLRLNLKSLGQDRKRFDKFIGKGSVAGHDIPDIALKKAVDCAAHQAVSKIMKGSFVLREIGRRQPVSHHHIRIVMQNQIHHLPGGLHRIGIIPVHHYIALRIDLTKHPADDISLSLHIFISHDRPCARR